MTDIQKTVSILGSTGSIGVQTLQVLEALGTKFRIAFLTANTKIDLLAKQIKQFNPIGIAISNEKAYFEFKKKYSFDGKILVGEEGVCEAATYNENDLIVQALVGFSGVKPTLSAIASGKNVALANKETLVSAGKIVTEAARKHKTAIIAVDSEHSAILQCLVGEDYHEIEKIILTASGGPFFNTPLSEFKNLTVKEALNHPRWSMGNKITIDSSTMMNKGFEIIEAYWLFKIPGDKIDVLIHPQSIIHSLVQFVDGSVKAQLGPPDMRMPISYALSFPRRFKFDFPRLDLLAIKNLEFIKPDFEKFPCIRYAYDALEEGGTAPVILNAANEVAVSAFLKEEISFSQIPETIYSAMQNINMESDPTIEEIEFTDKETRKYAWKLIYGLNHK